MRPLTVLAVFLPLMVAGCFSEPDYNGFMTMRNWSGNDIEIGLDLPLIRGLAEWSTPPAPSSRDIAFEHMEFPEDATIVWSRAGEKRVHSQRIKFPNTVRYYSEGTIYVTLDKSEQWTVDFAPRVQMP